MSGVCLLLGFRSADLPYCNSKGFPSGGYSFVLHQAVAPLSQLPTTSVSPGNMLPYFPSRLIFSRYQAVSQWEASVPAFLIQCVVSPVCSLHSRVKAQHWSRPHPVLTMHIHTAELALDRESGSIDRNSHSWWPCGAIHCAQKWLQNVLPTKLHAWALKLRKPCIFELHSATWRRHCLVRVPSSCSILVHLQS